MKGKIKSNLGRSRYVVSLSTSNALLRAEIEALKARRDASIKQVNALSEVEGTARAAYEAALLATQSAIADYQAELASYSLDDALDDEIALCQTARSDCEQKCFAKTEGVLDCLSECDADYDACALAAPRAASQRLLKYAQDTEKKWSPIVSEAQQDTRKKLSTLAEVGIPLANEKSRLLGIRIELALFESIDEKETNITCFSAQYDDALPVGAEVEVARTPAGRHAITSIVAVTNCLHDSRTLPAKFLVVDAAMAAGRETWVPTWRSGVVKALNDDNTLTVEFDPAALLGSLGTAESHREIECVPPLAYFSDEWQTIENRIRTAYESLKDAQTAYTEALAALDQCKTAFDATGLYNTKKANCELIWANWLIDCNQQADPSACQGAYDQSLAACLANAQAEVNEARATAAAVCDTQHQGAIAAAAAAVEVADRELRLARGMIRAPASPLVRDVAIGHCVKSSYAVGDVVLIDFPSRTHSRTDPAAVWKSARVIGWVENPQACATGVLIRSGVRSYAASGDGSVGLVADTPPQPLFGACYWHGRVNGESASISWDSGTPNLWTTVAAPLVLDHAITAAAKIRAHGADWIIYATLTGDALVLRARPLTGSAPPAEVAFATGTIPQAREGAVLQFSESGSRLAYAIPPLDDWVGADWPHVRKGAECNGCVWECLVPALPPLPPEPLPEGYVAPAPGAISWSRITPAVALPPALDLFYNKVQESALRPHILYGYDARYWLFFNAVNEKAQDWKISYNVVQGCFYANDELKIVSFTLTYSFSQTIVKAEYDNKLTTYVVNPNPIWSPYGATCENVGGNFIRCGAYQGWECEIGPQHADGTPSWRFYPVDLHQSNYVSTEAVVNQLVTITYPDQDPVVIFRDEFRATELRDWAGTFEKGNFGYSGAWNVEKNVSLFECEWTTEIKQARIATPAIGAPRAVLTIGPSGTRVLRGRRRCKADIHDYYWSDSGAFVTMDRVIDPPVYSEDLALNVYTNGRPLQEIAALEGTGITYGQIEGTIGNSWAMPIFTTTSPDDPNLPQYWLGPDTASPEQYLYRIPSDVYISTWPHLIHVDEWGERFIVAPDGRLVHWTFGVERARTDDDPPHRIVEGKLLGHISAVLRPGGTGHGVLYPSPMAYVEIAGVNYLVTADGEVGQKRASAPGEIEIRYPVAGSEDLSIGTLTAGSVPAMVPYPGVVPVAQ